MKSEPAPLPVVRARALDGVRLWLSFDPPTSGQIVLVAEDGSETIWGAASSAGPQTLLLPLEDVPGDEPAVFDLLFRSEAGDRPLCFAHDFAVPTRPPVTPDGRWRYRVVAPEGRLRLRRHAVAAVVPVEGMETCPEGLVVTWSVEHSSRLVVADESGTERHVLSSAVAGDVHRAVIPNGLALSADERMPLFVGDRGEQRPLGRPHHDLRQPMAAVLMPEVPAPGGVLRLVWSRDGELHVRLTPEDGA